MKKRRIVLEITSLLDVTFVSGIQRVVREILIRMLENRDTGDTEFILLYYAEIEHAFRRISSSEFLSVYRSKESTRVKWEKAPPYLLSALCSNDVFFDLDSVWNNRIRRSFLLPILKRQGVKIVVHVYDIIPVLFPEFCDQETTIRFLDYLGAHLLYADCVIANTKSTLNDIRALCQRLQTEMPKEHVVPLGSDFHVAGLHTACRSDLCTVDLPRSPYLLAVGTIEPRKDHSFLLDAYEKSLRELGFELVFAGRPGWNVENLMDRIHSLNRVDEHFHYYASADDSLISYLYANAFFTVFPSRYEGYGLPIIESICRGTPVLANDIPVLREVGREYARYFSSPQMEDLVRNLIQYTKEPNKYVDLKNMLSSYVPFTWDQSEEEMWKVLTGVFE